MANDAKQPSAADIQAKVEARAAAIAARVKKPPADQVQKKPLDKSFVLDCLGRNKVGDAALFHALFRDKYIFVEEWEKFLYWAGNHWQIDTRSRRAHADVERVCAAYQDAWAQSHEDEGSPLHKLLTSRLKSLRDPSGRNKLLECLTTLTSRPSYRPRRWTASPT